MRTIKVKDFLRDFDQAIDVLKSRFKPEYAASQEVLSLLRRGSDVELRHRRQGQTRSSAWPARRRKGQQVDRQGYARVAQDLDPAARANGEGRPLAHQG